ncbi:hypothetical protein [Bradyrhizobium sp. Ec3.3]|uniref:hypothetical protein n=1 Tax=Bradyrhizobium sp. Ec3.3 TaxID=189753 RepID=UPI0004853F68|nr:hypothetical protein [Bradyrhizobium sp. Ec3.3]
MNMPVAASSLRKIITHTAAPEFGRGQIIGRSHPACRNKLIVTSRRGFGAHPVQETVTFLFSVHG